MEKKALTKEQKEKVTGGGSGINFVCPINNSCTKCMSVFENIKTCSYIDERTRSMLAKEISTSTNNTSKDFSDIYSLMVLLQQTAQQQRQAASEMRNSAHINM